MAPAGRVTCPVMGLRTLTSIEAVTSIAVVAKAPGRSLSSPVTVAVKKNLRPLFAEIERQVVQ